MTRLATITLNKTGAQYLVDSIMPGHKALGGILLCDEEDTEFKVWMVDDDEPLRGRISKATDIQALHGLLDWGCRTIRM